MDGSIPRSKLSSLLIAAGIFIFYSGAAKLCLQMASIHPSATAIWAPTGIALAALLIFGEKFWIPIFAGAFVINYLTAGNLITSFVIAGGNTLEGLLGCMLVHQFANGRKVFEKASDILKFIVVAELVSTLVSPTAGVTILCVEGFARWGQYWNIWTTWWLGDLSGALLVTPALVLWYDDPKINPRYLPYTLPSFLALFLIGQAVFGNWIFPGQDLDAEFLCIPPLLWIAYRFDRKETATASLILCVIAVWNTVHGSGPFALHSKEESLLLLQVFMSLTSISALALAAAISERKIAEENLGRVQNAEKKLQDKIELIQLLQAITAVANESMTLPEAVQLSLKLICRYMGWPVGHVYYVDPANSRKLVSGDQWHLHDAHKYKNLQQATQNTVVKAGEGLVGRILANAAPYWIEDITHYSDFPRAKSKLDLKIHAAFGFPVMIGKNVVAVLEFFSDHSASPDTDLMESMKHVGTQLGRIIERHNAEQAQSELALLVETSTDFIVTTNPAGYILYLNKAGRAMVGLDSEANVDLLRHEDFIFQKDIPQLQAEVLNALMTHGHWEGEFTLRHFKTNEPVPIYFSAGLLRDPKTGVPSTLTAIGHNVTDIKKAEEAIQNSEKHFRALIENALDIVTILDADGRYTYLSPSTLNVLGYHPEELVGTNAFALIHPDDVEEVINKFKAALAEPEQAQSVEFRFKLKDGGWKPLESIGKNMLADPSVKGIVINSRDLTDKRAAEKEIDSANSFLSAVLENIPNMIFVKDAENLRFVMFNKAGENLIGVPRENLIGKNDYNFFTQEQADFFTSVDKKVIANGKLIDIAEENIKTQDKGERVLHTKKIPVFNDDGSPRFLLGISEDITEAKLAQKSLRESEEKFKLLMDNVQDYGIFLLDTTGHIVTWNEGAQKIKGYEESEIIGKHFSRFYTPQDIQDHHPEKLLEIAKKEGHVNDIGWRVKKDGSRFLADVIIQALHDDHGTFRGFAKVTRDITDRHEAEKNLRESDARFRSVVQSSPNAIVIANGKGNILSWNQGAQKTFGYSEEEIINQPFTQLFPAKYQEMYAINEENLQKPQNSKILDRTIELQGIRKNSTEFPIELSLSTWKIDDDTYFGGIIRDITERKKMEDLLRSNTELQQFANVASHDLQEPLRMVASYVQLLSEHLKGKLDEDATEYMGFAVDGAKRMQMLVNGLLEYSRVESRGKELQDVDMNQIFNQTIANLEIRIAETHAEIVHSDLPHVIGDPVQLTQLMQNLFSNALKFQKSKIPQINFSAKETDDEWVFTCKDNGIGIDPKYYDRIFVIFQRLHHRDEYSGTGLGLAVCKRIVERHGGRIWVESQPDSGAAFYFTLPKGTGHDSYREKLTQHSFSGRYPRRCSLDHRGF